MVGTFIMSSDSTKRKILVVTGSRAEYGLLYPVMKKIQQSCFLSLNLAVTGMHLLSEYGDTSQVIERDGFSFKRVKMYDSSEDSLSERSLALARGISGFTHLIGEVNPNFLLVLGDRLEPFSSVLAASVMGIPIAHIHGGDTSACGQIDDSIRHSISKFAHIHFAASKQSAARLEKMGEMPWRVFIVGSPGVDNVVNGIFASKDVLFGELRLDPRQKTLICLQHSVTLEMRDVEKQMIETMEAIRKLGMQTVVIYPNNDPGSVGVISVIESYREVPFIRIVKSMEHQQFVSLLRYVDVMVGNSSSGVTEAPSFKLPSVSIGTRQVGREHASNVLFVDHDREEIVGAVQKSLFDAKFRSDLKYCQNPYGDGNASDKIVSILERMPLGENFMRKRISY